jgi:iron complex outermembrane receptor protein
MIYSRCNRAVAAAVACALAASVVTPKSAFAQEATQTTPRADDDSIPQVIITGSFIKRPADRPQPLTVVGSEDLANTQRNSVAESLKDLPQNVGSMATVNTQGGGVNAGNTPTTTVNLRGLGAGASLVLLNGGRQIADGGFGYVDVNNLAPSIMIERVEVLTDGSSALYGADAVGGVVNFITKTNFSGFNVEADFQHIQDTSHDRPDTNVGLLWGGHNDNTSVVAGLEYQTTEILLTDDRYDADRLKLGLSSGFGNPSTFQYRNKTGVQPSATLASIPDPLCGSTQLSDGGPSGLANGVVNTTGTPSCLLYNALGRALQPKSKRFNGLATISHNFSDTLTGDFELGFARTRYWIPFGYVTPATATASLFPLVPTDNPGAVATARKFPTFAHPLNGQTNIAGYLYKGRILSPWVNDGQSGDIRTSGQDTYRISGRLNGKFGNSGWDWQVGFSDSWNDTNFLGHDTVINRVSLAVNGYGGPRCAYNPTNDPTGAKRGVDTCKFWDPFAISALVPAGDPAANDPTVTNWLVGNRTTHDSGELKTYQAVTTGKLWDMPGGTTGLAVGLERREVNFSQQWDEGSKQIGYYGFNGAFAQSDFSGANATNAAFAELVMYPLKSLEVQLAGRHEKTSYENAGSFSKFNPKIGLLWTPVHGLFVRGSAGTSFQAPGPAAMFAQSTGGTSAQQIGGDTINARGLLMGNPNLQPQTSRNWNVGVTWDVTDNFTAELNYWNIRFKDLITGEVAQQILNADLADGFITDSHIVLNPGAPNEVCEITGRWKPGQGPRPANCMSGNDILQFTTTYINQGFLHTNGIDYDFKYRLKLDSGWQFPFRLYGTYTREYEMLQAGVLYDGVGKYNDSTFGVPMPEYTANLQAGVMTGAHSLMATVRYLPALTLQVPNPATNAGTESASFTTIDLLYRYQLPWSDGSSVTAAVRNVTNKEDPIAGGSQLTTFGNLYTFFGRVFRVGVDYKF